MRKLSLTQDHSVGLESKTTSPPKRMRTSPPSGTPLTPPARVSSTFFLENAFYFSTEVLASKCQCWLQKNYFGSFYFLKKRRTLVTKPGLEAPGMFLFPGKDFPFS